MRGWKVPTADEYTRLGLHLRMLCSDGACVHHQEKALLGKNYPQKCHIHSQLALLVPQVAPACGED